MALEALTPLEPAPRELEFALSGSGQAVSQEPTDAEAAAQFAEWFVRAVVPGRMGLHLVEPASMRTVELTGNELAASGPDAALVLSHAFSWIVAEYLPGRGVHAFPSRTSLDSDAIADWRPWIVGSHGL